MVHFFFIFHALSFELNILFNGSFPKGRGLQFDNS